jgi:hypothetical protein
MPDTLPAAAQYEIVVAGDSHIGALGIPLAARDRVMRLHDLGCSWARVAGLVGVWKGNRKLVAEWQGRGDPAEAWKGHRNAEYWEALVALAAGKTIALSGNGNQHNANFIFAPTPLFDFLSPMFPRLEPVPESELVPHKLIKAHFADSLVGLHALVERLGKVRGCRTVILGSPPPKKALERLMGMLVEDEYWRALAQRLGVDRDRPKLMPASIRLKLWGVIQELMSELAEQHRVAFLPSPTEAMDAIGFLKEEYWAKDVTHANRGYGTLVEQQLCRLHVTGPKTGRAP